MTPTIRMPLRLLLALSFPVLLAAQSADYHVTINATPLDEERRTVMTFEVLAKVPLADPEKLTLEVNSFGTLATEAVTTAGIRCEDVTERVWMKCTIDPLAAGERVSVTVQSQTVYDPRDVRVIAIMRWKERGHREEARDWYKDLSRVEREFAVTTTDDAGPGSLRQAILDASANCSYFRAKPCLIRFDIPPASTIRPLTPLPAVTGGYITIEARWPVAIDGSLLTTPANGLVSAGDSGPFTVRGLTIHSFPENGIELPGSGSHLVDSCVITGNGSRGIVSVGSSGRIENSVISGNGRSGVFIAGGQMAVVRNRIGVAADGVTPLPNGASGIFAYGASASIVDNVIAHNGHVGIGTLSRERRIDVGRNRIVANRHGQIDIDLDGRSHFPQVGGVNPPNGPVLESATYDPAANRTTVRGRLDPSPFYYFLTYEIQFYATTEANEADQFLGGIHITQPDFTFSVVGDLQGRLVTATTTRWLHEEINDRTISELSTPIEVSTLP